MSSDWGNVSRDELLRSLRGAAVAALTGGSLTMLGLMLTGKWDREDLSDAVMPTVGTLAGLFALVVAVLAERVRGWRIIVPLYALVVAGFLWLNLNDASSRTVDAAVMIAMAVAGVALAVYVVPQLADGAAALRARFAGKHGA